MAVGDEIYLKGDSNRDGSIRYVVVADQDADGIPDLEEQQRYNGRWITTRKTWSTISGTDAGVASASFALDGANRAPVTLKDRFKYYLTSADLGLVGDGSDTNAEIQTAIDEAGGKTLEMLPGTYIGEDITISTDNTKLLHKPGAVWQLKTAPAVQKSLLKVAARNVLIDGGEFDFSNPSIADSDHALIRVDGLIVDRLDTVIRNGFFKNVNRLGNQAIMALAPDLVTIENNRFQDCEHAISGRILGSITSDIRAFTVRFNRARAPWMRRLLSYANELIASQTSIYDIVRGIGTQVCANQALIEGWRGTVQSATATTTTLQSGQVPASSLGDTFLVDTGVYSYLRITQGTGAGQVRALTSWNATTRVAGHTAWSVTPDGTSKYLVWRQGDLAIEMQGISTIVAAEGSYGMAGQAGVIASLNYTEKFSFGVSLDGVCAGAAVGNSVIDSNSYGLEGAGTILTAYTGNAAFNKDLDNTEGVGIGFNQKSYGNTAIGNAMANTLRGVNAGTRGNLIAANVISGVSYRGVYCHTTKDFITALNVFLRKSLFDGTTLGENRAAVHALDDAGPGVIGLNLFGHGYVDSDGYGQVLVEGHAAGLVPTRLALLFNHYGVASVHSYRLWNNGGDPTNISISEPLGQPYDATHTFRVLWGTEHPGGVCGYLSSADPPAFAAGNGSVAFTSNGKVFKRAAGAWAEVT